MLADSLPKPLPSMVHTCVVLIVVGVLVVVLVQVRMEWMPVQQHSRAPPQPTRRRLLPSRSMVRIVVGVAAVVVWVVCALEQRHYCCDWTMATRNQHPHPPPFFGSCGVGKNQSHWVFVVVIVVGGVCVIVVAVVVAIVELRLEPPVLQRPPGLTDRHQCVVTTMVVVVVIHHHQW